MQSVYEGTWVVKRVETDGSFCPRGHLIVDRFTAVTTLLLHQCLIYNHVVRGTKEKWMRTVSGVRGYLRKLRRYMR